MKRLLCSVLALMLLMLGTCTPALAEKLVDSGDVGTIHWELDSKGKLTVTGTGKIEIIPATKYYAKKIKSIEIGDDITEIGDGAFGSMQTLTKITIGAKVRYIHFGAFSTCCKVQSIEFRGDQVTENFEFLSNMMSNKLKEVIYPETAHIVVENGMVFSEDKKLLFTLLQAAPKSLYIPTGTEQFGDHAICDSRVQEVFLPQSINTFSSVAFSFCSQLTNVYFLDIASTLHLSGIYPLIICRCGVNRLTLPPFVIDNSWSSSSIIDDCNRLKYLALGEGTQTLGYQAITRCPALEKLYLPQSITEISDNAIDYSPKLTLMVREGSYAETFAKENGFKYAYFTPVSGIELSEQALTLKKGKSVALTAEIAPADATEQTLIWCSSDPKVATVTKGKVKAVGVGSCEIICYASDGSNARTVCSLTVEK